MNYLDFQKALDKSTKLLRKPLRPELWEERPNSVHYFRVYWEERAGKEARAAVMGGGCSSLSGALSLNFSVKYAQQLHMHQLIKVPSQAQKN